jgi:Mycothiol maleylpyruvate isomerase N-terminal domain
MGARSDMLAKQFEEKAGELTDTIEKMSDADWKKVTSAEKWTVGVTAHHVAGSHEPISGIIKAVAAGQTLPPFTSEMLDGMNAQHAKDFAGCTKAETLALHKQGVTSSSAVVKGLSDADLAKSGTVMTGMPAMTVQQIVEGVLINHVQDHLGSIRNTVGK